MFGDHGYSGRKTAFYTILMLIFVAVLMVTCTLGAGAPPL